MAAVPAAATAAVTIKPEKRLPMTISLCLATCCVRRVAANFEVPIISRRARLGTSNLILLGVPAPMSPPGVVDGFALEWRHKCRGLAHLARLLIRISEADDLHFVVWFAKERDGHRQALGSEAHRNDNGRKAD